MGEVGAERRAQNLGRDLTRERKGLGSSKLAGWKPITRATRELI